MAGMQKVNNRMDLGQVLLICLLMVLTLIGGGLSYLAPSVWYEALSKPIFALARLHAFAVWLAIYVLNGVAAVLLFGRQRQVASPIAYVLFVAKMVCSATYGVWMILLEAPLPAAFSIMLGIWAATFLLKEAFRVHPAAGWLLVPNLLWLGYIALVHAMLSILN